MSIAPATEKLLRLDARKLAVWLGGAALVEVLIQLVLGGSPLVVLLAAMTTGLGLCAFVAMGANNLAAWLATAIYESLAVEANVQGDALYE